MPRGKGIRTNDPSGMRNRILDAAAHTFQISGYHATSMNDLQRLACVSGGAMTHHFATKRQIALATIEERVAVEVGVTWIQAVTSAISAREGILAVFEKTITQLEEAGSISGCPLGNLASELALENAAFQSALAAQYALWQSAIAGKLTQDMSDNKRADPAAFAAVVVALFSGALVIGKAEQTTAALRACLEHLRTMTA